MYRWSKHHAHNNIENGTMEVFGSANTYLGWSWKSSRCGGGQILPGCSAIARVCVVGVCRGIQHAVGESSSWPSVLQCWRGACCILFPDFLIYRVVFFFFLFFSISETSKTKLDQRTPAEEEATLPQDYLSQIYWYSSDKLVLRDIQTQPCLSSTHIPIKENHPKSYKSVTLCPSGWAEKETTCEDTRLFLTLLRCIASNPK